jgi:O-methyltransferase
MRGIYKRFSDLTMLPEDVYIDNLKLIEPFAKDSGCIVECGVWKGGMMGGMASVLGSSRPYALFDSFRGLPEAKLVDGDSALEWQTKTDAPDYFDNCSANKSFAVEAMRRAGCNDVSFHEGWFDVTLKDYKAPRTIDVLRLDGDWYESTMTCLTSLFDQVTPGGIIILDDYHVWDGCSRALHDFLSRRAATERIMNLGKVCFLYKKNVSP